MGLISSSSAYNYAAEATDLLDLDASILKLGMTHPLPERMIAQFLLAHRKIIIIEELEPYLETQLKALAKDCAPNVEIYGKTARPFFSRKGELSTREVATSLSKITGKKLEIDFDGIDKRYMGIIEGLPSRPPILCAGCPHRASFYVISKVGKHNAIYPTDIGCYALGIVPPLGVGDLLICMGSSVSTAQGMSRVTGRNTIAIMGDSTFFHGGMPGLLNLAYNKTNVCVVVLDNRPSEPFHELPPLQHPNHQEEQLHKKCHWQQQFLARRCLKKQCSEPFHFNLLIASKGQSCSQTPQP